MSLLEAYHVAPKRILEIGCSNGWRLDLLRKRYGATCVGVEPSLAAIRDGRKRYPQVKIHRGVASALPLKGAFDLVLVPFVLHWVARERLLQSISEIDRVLSDNGLLLISDFAPDFPTRVHYHHLAHDEVYTFKLDYAQIFSSTAMYATVGRLAFDHDEHRLGVDVSGPKRGVSTLLRKSYKDFLLEQQRASS